MIRLNAYEAFLTKYQVHWNWSCNIQTHRPTAQETWRRDWPKRRSRDRNVTGSNENSLKKLTHYGDRDDTPLVFVSRLYFFAVVCGVNTCLHPLSAGFVLVSYWKILNFKFSFT